MEIDVYIDEKKEKIDYEKVKNVYIQGICGTAMSGVAKILIEDGKKVYGADNNFYSPIKEALEDLKIEIIRGLKPENLQKNPDLVIVGNIMSRDHLESIEVRKKKIPYISFPELFKNYYLKNKISLVVGGTNGKTTTTALLAHSLDCLNQKPSFFVGGIPKNFSTNARLETGKYFVLEGDEYETAYFEKTPKFWHYTPYSTIITSISYDHIDFFPTYKDYKKAFLKFIDLIPKEGKIIICYEDSKDLLNLIKGRKILTYGFNKKAEFFISKILNKNMKGLIYEVLYKNEKINIKIPLWGGHNIKNSLAVFCLLKNLGFENEEILKTFNIFKGVKRRQEVFYKKEGFILIDDYAHHPMAVYVTLQSIKNHLKNFKLIAIFEPRTNTSRTSFFEKEYSKSFKYADKVIILPPPPPKGGKKPLNLHNLINKTKKEGKDVLLGNNLEEVISYIGKTLKPKTAIVTLSNGPMDGLHRKLLCTFF